MTQQTSQPGVPSAAQVMTTAPQVTTEVGKNQATATVVVPFAEHHVGVISKKA